MTCIVLRPGLRYVCGIAQDESSRADLASLLLAASQPYARALYGDGPAAATIYRALMCQSSSELSGDRLQLLMEERKLLGCYVALAGRDVAACHRAELVEALRYFGPGAADILGTRLASLGPLFAPVGENEFYLSKLAVRPEARGRGIGRLLLDHYIARARKLGFRHLRLDLSSDNDAARRLYEAAGFRPVEQRCSARFGLTYISMRAVS